MPTLPGSFQSQRETFSLMVDRKTDIETLVQQIRLCRLKLGAALNRLDNFAPNAQEAEEIRDCSDDILCEINILITALQRMQGH